MKSHHSKPGAGLESPTGYRSRGPSAERQARKLERAELKHQKVNLRDWRKGKGRYANHA